MKDLGSLSNFLGLEVLSSSDDLFLSQAKYASDLVSRADLTNCKIKHTPLQSNFDLLLKMVLCLTMPLFIEQLIGSLIYLTVTRPDISYAVHLASQFMASPHTTNYVVLRIIQYIKGTMFYDLHYSTASLLILRAYSDADWASEPSDHPSTTFSFVFFLETACSTLKLNIILLLILLLRYCGFAGFLLI